MKKIILLSIIFTACFLNAHVIHTEAMDCRGHVQGIAADETGIYCSFAYERVKVDYNGKTLFREKVFPHSGDIASDGKMLYCAVNLWDSKLAEKYGANSCIFIYDRNFKLLKVKPFKTLRGIDGIAFINGKFYVGLNYLGSKLRTGNKIAILDKNLNLLKIAAVTIGRNTKFGPQTLNNFRGRLLAGFYGGGGRSFIFSPEELEKSDTVVSPVDSLPADTTVGFSELPPSFAPAGAFIVARNRRKIIDPKTKKRTYGVAFTVYTQDEDGKLKKVKSADFAPAKISAEF